MEYVYANAIESAHAQCAAGRQFIAEPSAAALAESGHLNT